MLNRNSTILLATLSISNVATAAPLTVSKEQAAQALTGLSVPFEENRGQTDSKVAFQARTLAGPLFVTKTGELVWTLAPSSRAGEAKRIPPLSDPVMPAGGMRNTPALQLQRRDAPALQRRDAPALQRRDAPALHSAADFVGPPAPTYSVVEKFIGGAPQPAGVVPSATQVSYFHGNDRSKWQNSVPTWNQVSLGEVWPGIDVKLAARGKNVEKLFTVAPGADVNKIAIAVKGGEVTVAKDGGLNVAPSPLVGEGRGEGELKVGGNGLPPTPALPHKGGGRLAFTAPVAYQLINGERKPVTVAYRLFPPSSRGRARVGVETVAESQPPSQPSPYQEEGAVYGFTLGVHDVTQPVVIDPLLQSKNS